MTQTNPTKKLMRRLTLPKEVAILEDLCDKTQTFKWKWFRIKKVQIKHGKISLFDKSALSGFSRFPDIYTAPIYFYVNGHKLLGYGDFRLWENISITRKSLEAGFRLKFTSDLNAKAGKQVSLSKPESKKAIQKFYGVKLK